MQPPSRREGDAIPPVAFDMTAAISGRTGVARYVDELGAALEREGVPLRRWAVGRAMQPPPPKTRWIRTPARLLAPCWRVGRIPRIEWFLDSVEFVHATGALMPATGLPLVVTVHDVAAIRFPGLHPSRHVAQQHAHLRALGQATVVLTVSWATADDLLALGVPAERLVVAPLGMTPMPVPSEPVKLDLPKRYLLCVGETSPRKRLELPLLALAHLRTSDLGLVLVGPPAAAEARIRNLISSLPQPERVVRLKQVSDLVLSGLYHGAVALCFPSASEGFGLPVLEAMAAGLPVIASEIPTTREVAAGAAMFPSSATPEAWAESIEAVVSDAHLRDELGAQGRQRAAEFTWQRTARATLEGYRLALASTL